MEFVMMKRSSFNQTIHFQVIISLFLLVVLICSCKKEEFYSSLRTYSEIRDKVVQASWESLTFDALEYRDKVCLISFSNGDKLVVPIDSLIVLTID